MKYTLATVMVLLPIVAHSSELTFGFNSPAFSGNGYSTHVLTIHQLEQQRKDKLEADAQAEIDRAERAYRNTNAYKFQNNLESRIYAQLSRQIADNLFGEESATITDGEWYSADTPFGDNISWKREDGRIYVVVNDSNGNTVAEFDVPVGEFAF